MARGLKGALVVPGSMQVKAAAEKEGLDRIFRDAGFEWRDAGCSMCIGMNADVLPSGDNPPGTPPAHWMITGTLPAAFAGVVTDAAISTVMAE